MEDHGMTDARLRELYVQSLALRGRPDRERCAPAEAIVALIRREGPEARRLETLDHVMGCRACHAELDLLRSIEDAAKAEPAPRRGWSWSWLAPVALAAAVALFIGVRVATQGPDVTRGGDDAVTLLAPAAEVDAGPVTFTWQPVPDAVRYDVEVTDEHGRLVTAQTTDETSLGLELPPGSYRWLVRASPASGEPRASAARRLRVRQR